MTANVEAMANLKGVIDTVLLDFGIVNAHVNLSTNEKDGEVTTAWVSLWFENEILCTLNSLEEWNALVRFSHLLSGPTCFEIERDFQEQQKAAQAFLDSGKAI